jgi:diacylglycerol kinase (ATP)
MKGQSFFKRLGFAINGLEVTFLRERSFRCQTIAAVAVLMVLLFIRPSPIWWAIGSLTVGFVLVAELINTAIETLVDRIHPDRHPEIQVVKDVAAGAVLVASIVGTLVVAAFFYVYFYQL